MTPYELVSSDAVLKQLLDEAVAAVCAKEGAILLLSEDGKFLRFVVATAGVADKLRGVEQPLSKGITSLAVSLQQPMIVNETGRDASFDPSVDAKTGMKTQSIMVIPLVDPDEEFGALTAVNSTASTGFTTEDLERYSDFAEQISNHLSEIGFHANDVGAAR